MLTWQLIQENPRQLVMRWTVQNVWNGLTQFVKKATTYKHGSRCHCQCWREANVLSQSNGCLRRRTSMERFDTTLESVYEASSKFLELISFVTIQQLQQKCQFVFYWLSLFEKKLKDGMQRCWILRQLFLKQSLMRIFSSNGLLEWWCLALSLTMRRKRHVWNWREQCKVQLKACLPSGKNVQHIGMVKCQADPCVWFTVKNKTTWLIWVVYVDDIIFTGKEEARKWFKD